jgi:radical SAM protein with 4Fe4S-binding SPASM domain
MREQVYVQKAAWWLPQSGQVINCFLRSFSFEDSRYKAVWECAQRRTLVQIAEVLSVDRRTARVLLEESVRRALIATHTVSSVEEKGDPEVSPLLRKLWIRLPRQADPSHPLLDHELAASLLKDLQFMARHNAIVVIEYGHDAPLDALVPFLTLLQKAHDAGELSVKLVLFGPPQPVLEHEDKIGCLRVDHLLVRFDGCLELAPRFVPIAERLWPVLALDHASADQLHADLKTLRESFPDCYIVLESKDPGLDRMFLDRFEQLVSLARTRARIRLFPDVLHRAFMSLRTLECMEDCQGCGAGVNRLAVDTDGTVYPCERLVGRAFPLGRLASDGFDLRNVFGSARARQFADWMKQRRDLCERTCVLSPACRGCIDPELCAMARCIGQMLLRPLRGLSSR